MRSARSLVVAIAALTAASIGCVGDADPDPDLDSEDTIVAGAGTGTDADCGCTDCDRPPWLTPTPTPSPTPAPTPAPTPEATPTGDPDLDLLRDGKGDCDGYEVPKGCFGIGGTDMGSIKWMECHRQQHSTFDSNRDFIGTSCPISSDDRKSILDECKMKTSDSDKIVCIGRAIKEKLMGDPKRVCRHHAMCGYKIIGELFGTDFECGHNHCWTEVPTDSGTYVIDPYNVIFYYCPK